MSEETENVPVKSDRSLRGKFDPNHVCNYCSGKGHWRNECPVLRRKSKSGFSTAKPAGAAASVCAEDRACVIAAVQAHTKLLSSESATGVSVVEQEQTDFLTDDIDSGYAVFLSDGFVSLVGSETRVPVKILRDSGALDSFILDSVLPFSSETETGFSVDV